MYCCFTRLFLIDNWQINQPIIYRELYILLDKIIEPEGYNVIHVDIYLLEPVITIDSQSVLLYFFLDIQRVR